MAGPSSAPFVVDDFAHPAGHGFAVVPTLGHFLPLQSLPVAQVPVVCACDEHAVGVLVVELVVELVGALVGALVVVVAVVGALEGAVEGAEVVELVGAEVGALVVEVVDVLAPLMVMPDAA